MQFLTRTRMPKHIMMCAYDDYRDSSERGKTIGASVWSIDAELTKYFSAFKYAGLLPFVDLSTAVTTVGAIILTWSRTVTSKSSPLPDSTTFTV